MSYKTYSYEWLSGKELKARFPQFHTDDNYVAVYQKDGGLVDAAMANAVHVQLARGNGASFIEKCPVLRIARCDNGNVKVRAFQILTYKFLSYLLFQKIFVWLYSLHHARKCSI